MLCCVSSGNGFVALASVLTLAAGLACADVFNMPIGETSLQFVTVGDPGNAAERRRERRHDRLRLGRLRLPDGRSTT